MTSIIPFESEIFLGFILIFSFGILHGSNDILLIETISNKRANYPFLKIIGIYLLTVLAAVGVFYFIPLLALILFILFSSFHFGEQHWEHKIVAINKSIMHIYSFIYGLFILTLLFLINADEVILVIKSISQYQITRISILYGFFISLISLLGLTIYLFYISPFFKSIFIKELVYLLIFSVVFNVSSLIWGFTIYFIFWHSIPSLYEQITFIYGNFERGSVLSYIKKALPYWFISIVGLVIVYFVFKETHLIYAILFSFIAAVTFPHSIVITKMFKQKTNPKVSAYEK